MKHSKNKEENKHTKKKFETNRIELNKFIVKITYIFFNKKKNHILILFWLFLFMTITFDAILERIDRLLRFSRFVFVFTTICYRTHIYIILWKKMQKGKKKLLVKLSERRKIQIELCICRKWSWLYSQFMPCNFFLLFAVHGHHLLRTTLVIDRLTQTPAHSNLDQNNAGNVKKRKKNSLLSVIIDNRPA